MAVRIPHRARSLSRSAPRDARGEGLVSKALQRPAPPTTRSAEAQSISQPSVDGLNHAQGIGSIAQMPLASSNPFASQTRSTEQNAAAARPFGGTLLEKDVLDALRKGEVFDFRGDPYAESQSRELLEISQAVAKFRKRPPEIAASLLQFQLGGKSASEIHTELLSLGFDHHCAPLNGRPQPRIVDREDGRPIYATRGGGETFDPRDPDIEMERTYVRENGSLALSPEEPNLVMQDLYVHPDGGMVRVKAQGDPSSLMRPEPHASRSVLLEASSPDGRFDVRYDSGWRNEGFKVDDEGNPAPKAPNAAFGMRTPRPPHGQLATRSKNYGAAFTDALMSAVHINLLPESS